MRASETALGPEPQQRRKAIVLAAALAAVMVDKKDSHLEEDRGSGVCVCVLSSILQGSSFRPRGSVRRSENDWSRHRLETASPQP